MATKKKSGLGADALFSTDVPPIEQSQTADKEQPKEEKRKNAAGASLRTTVMLPPDCVILLGRMKEQSILDGNRQTQGEVIAEAIRTLARIKGISV